MIAEVLQFFRKRLDDHLRLVIEGAPDNATADKVVFVDGDAMDPIQFKVGAVTLLLVNVQEERLLRGADPYVRRDEDGRSRRVQPDIRLGLQLLFVARFKNYETAWIYLSRLIEYLQSVRVFDAEVAPDLPTGVDKLVVELVTLTLAEQNEVWNALRTAQHPSVMYGVKLITFRDPAPVEPPLISVIETRVGDASR